MVAMWEWVSFGVEVVLEVIDGVVIFGGVVYLGAVEHDGAGENLELRVRMSSKAVVSSSGDGIVGD